MKILNLVYPEKSDIKYKVNKFPDGQRQIVIEKFTKDWMDKLQIKTRLNNFMDLELLVCAVKSLNGLGWKEIHLYVPYFLGSRSDRKFEEGSNNYLKDVICPIINSLDFESVTVLDPHSDVLESCLNNFAKIDNSELVNYAISSKYEFPFHEIDLKKSDFLLISPDAGATKKIHKLADKIGYKGDVITCSKDRDKDGKLTKITVPVFTHPTKTDLIIIDDICDGGATFINISKAIRNGWHNNKIYLVVTHGIFSKGYDELIKHFNGIYYTNSYRDHPKTHRGDILNCLKKPLNVF